jgi:hypothetical protein
MIRFRIFLPLAAVLVGAVMLGAPAAAHAGFAIRITELSSGGALEASSTTLNGGGPGTTFTAIAALPDFTVNVVTNTSSFGTDFARHDTSISVTYRAGAPVGVGISDRLLIEVLGDSYMNPMAPAPSQITSNGSASSGTHGLADSIVMQSTVITGNVALSGTPGTTLTASGMGTTTNTGAVIPGFSTTFVPNPAKGAIFPISNPFTFYQTYVLQNVTVTGTASVTGATEVDAVTPVPASLILVLSGLPILGAYCWLRRRNVVQMA